MSNVIEIQAGLNCMYKPGIKNIVTRVIEENAYFVVPDKKILLNIFQRVLRINKEKGGGAKLKAYSKGLKNGTWVIRIAETTPESDKEQNRLLMDFDFENLKQVDSVQFYIDQIDEMGYTITHSKDSANNLIWKYKTARGLPKAHKGEFTRDEARGFTITELKNGKCRVDLSPEFLKKAREFKKAQKS